MPELQPDLLVEEVASHWHEEERPTRPLRLHAAPGSRDMLAAVLELWRVEQDITHLIGVLGEPNQGVVLA
eukprot:6236264-Alexandrium_andersonii.AAC.1